MLPGTPRSPRVLKCSVGSKLYTDCGRSARYPLVKEFIPITSCNRDITLHLKRVKLASSSVSSESELILLRAGFFNADAQDKTVCPKHRDLLGLSWRPSRVCNHPLHEKRKTKKCDRGVSKQMSLEIYERWKTFVPIGSGKL